MVECLVSFILGGLAGMLVMYEHKEDKKYGYKVTKRGVFTLIEKDNEP